MQDIDGPHVTNAVYGALLRGAKAGHWEVNPDDIPYALDEAIAHLRDKGHPPARWATYIHIGI